MCNGDKNSIFWRDRNVYVTGASGLLGRWLVNALNTAGANVVGLIRDWCRSNPSDWRHQPVALHSALRFTVFGNLEDYELQLRTLNEYEIDTVFHLGAQPIVGVANRNPRSTFEANIRGTWNILEACRHIKTVQRVIMASSDKAYGDQPNLPYEESMPLQGKHPYDVSKSCADLIAQTYHNTYGIPVCITRCGNFFGGGDLNFNRIVP
ncbi:MAG: GDP-mannose 4,6-dehydratase, partial [Gammaproteobacteria bacterium]